MSTSLERSVLSPFDAWAAEATAVNEDGVLKHPELLEAGLVERCRAIFCLGTGLVPHPENVDEDTDCPECQGTGYVAVGGDTGVVRALEWLPNGHLSRDTDDDETGTIYAYTAVGLFLTEWFDSLRDAVWDACLRAVMS